MAGFSWFNSIRKQNDEIVRTREWMQVLTDLNLPERTDQIFKLREERIQNDDEKMKLFWNKKEAHLILSPDRHSP